MAITGPLSFDEACAGCGAEGEPHAGRDEGGREGEQQRSGNRRPEPCSDRKDQHRQQPREGHRSGISARILQRIAANEDSPENSEHRLDGRPGPFQRRGPALWILLPREDKTQHDGNTRPFEGGTGQLQLVNLEQGAVGRATFLPGWRWSEHVKPIAKTESCQAAHMGYFVSGRMKVVMNDGEEMEYGPGDFATMAPGHDAWVLGDEPCVVIDWQGFADYAKP